jgi:hypothetical protein
VGAHLHRLLVVDVRAAAGTEAAPCARPGARPGPVVEAATSALRPLSRRARLVEACSVRACFVEACFVGAYFFAVFFRAAAFAAFFAAAAFAAFFKARREGGVASQSVIR